MTTPTGSDSYHRGLALAEAGQYEEAWDCLGAHLRDKPQDAAALNDAGTVLHYLGRTDEALDLLTQARQLRAEDTEIAENLVEVYLAAGRAVEAARLFDVLERHGALRIDVLNRTATLLLDQGRRGPALNVLLCSDRLWPGQKELRPILDTIRSQRPKVAFFCASGAEDEVLADIGRFVQQRFPTEFHEGRSPAGLERLLHGGDIAWCDGGGDLAVAASRGGGRTKLVVSMRASDVRERWVPAVQWENVHTLVQLGSTAAGEMLREQVPDLGRRTRLAVVPHGVDLRRYALRRRERGKHLACLGGLTLEANPALVLQGMQKLHYLDPAYRLSFAGTFESPLLEQYLRHMVRTLELTDVVSFEPRPDDWNAWLSDKHFVVAGGIGENQLAGLLLGMACGLKPVVHHFPGADQWLPAQHLFRIAEQFCEQILTGDYRPAQYRCWVEQRYPLEARWQSIEEILGQLETELAFPAAVTADRIITVPAGPRAPVGTVNARR